MENVPVYIAVAFALTAIATVYFFFKATRGSRMILGIVIGWTLLQSVVSLTGFYTNTSTLPPRFALLIAPPVLFIAALFATQRGRTFIDSLDLKWLTLLHTIRVPVELILFGLFAYGVVPKIMTFEGRNLDVLSGLTAPLVYYIAFVKRRSTKALLLTWNIATLALLVNIVVIAILSAPFAFQKFGFEQPNVGVMYFPFTWLPCLVVPLVLFAQLVGIRRSLVPTSAQTQKQTLREVAV